MEYLPIKSQWYRQEDQNREFQVVSLDEDEGTVNLQHFDGELETVDIDDWYVMEIEPIETPADWVGPEDEAEIEDDEDEEEVAENDWEEPLSEDQDWDKGDEDHYD